MYIGTSCCFADTESLWLESSSIIHPSYYIWSEYGKKIGTLKSFSLLLYTNELFLSLSHFWAVKFLQIL